MWQLFCVDTRRVFTVQRPKYRTFDQNFNFYLRTDHPKKSYERRAYESINEKNLS